MTAVQLLFAPENKGVADKIAAGLASSGYTALSDGSAPAQAVIVIWSASGASSSRVIAGARAALAARILVPVAIGKTPPPPSFEHIWPVDLAGWAGNDDDPRWRFVLDEIELAVRRGVEFAPSADEAAGEAAGEAASGRPDDAEFMPARAPDASFSDDEEGAGAEGLFAVSPTHAPAVVRPRPRLPALAIFAGVSVSTVLGLAVGAFFIGMSQQGAIVRAATSAPLVAFVEPKNQPGGMAEFDAENFPPRPDFINAPTSTAAEGAAFAAMTEPPSSEKLREATQDESARQLSQSSGKLPSPSSTLSEPAPMQLTDDVGVHHPDNLIDDNPPGEPVNDPDTDLFAAQEASPDDEIDAIVTASLEQPADLPEFSEAAEDAYFGNYFRECVECPDLAEIAPGAFMFGSPADEDQRVEAEGPLTFVMLSQPFAIGVREVTNGEWRKCVAAGACRAVAANADKLPVVGVTWDDARDYVVWLSRKTGSNYRLPTEAEWEFAARAGASTPFSFGAALAPDEANYKASAPYHGPAGPDRGRPVASGSFAPNGFGLYDMHGNVWELTADCWSADHAGAPSDGAARGGHCSTRVVKGGAYSTPGSRLRSAHRSYVGQDDRRPDMGFRIARDM
ncbi:MAG: SUMF1/EgtB/PvdO family nonheme iron enzyme [Parvularculaceae bacterium]